MKTKKLLITLFTLLTTSICVYSQADTTILYNLKLHTESVGIKKIIGNKKISKYKFIDSYFFFSNHGIYAADKFGILIYRFTSKPIEVNPRSGVYEFKLDAYDTKEERKCEIVVYINENYDDIVLYMYYDDYTFIFSCEYVN